MHTRTGAWWLYATAVILAANAITSRVFGAETGSASIVLMLLAILAGMLGVHLDHRNYLAQQRAKKRSPHRDLFGRYSFNRVARHQFNDANVYREQLIASVQVVLSIEKSVKTDLMLAKNWTLACRRLIIQMNTGAAK